MMLGTHFFLSPLSFICTVNSLGQCIPYLCIFYSSEFLFSFFSFFQSVFHIHILSCVDIHILSCLDVRKSAWISICVISAKISSLKICKLVEKIKRKIEN